MEFPFSSPNFIKKLEKKIQRWQRRLKGSETTKGQFLRSADFDYRDYIDSPDLRIIYLLEKRELQRYKSYIAKNLYKFLEGKAK